MLETSINVHPIGIHRLGDAIEFAVYTTPQDAINLRNFYITRDGIDIYLLQDNEDILIVNSCGYEFRETVATIGKTLTASAKVVHYYRQYRKYNGRYAESGTLTFWIKDIQHPIVHKIDKRRRCYFNDAKHSELLTTASETTLDLNTDEDTDSLPEEETITVNFEKPLGSPSTSAAGTTDDTLVNADEPPVKRRVISAFPLNPDSAPATVAEVSKASECTASVPDPIIRIPDEFAILAYTTPLPLTPAISPATPSYNTTPTFSSLSRYKIDDTHSPYFGLNLDYKQFHEIQGRRPRLPHDVYQRFRTMYYNTSPTEGGYIG